MIHKPSSRDGYDFGQLSSVQGTLLYLATKLGDLLDEMVIVGGLVPYLLVDQQNLPADLDPHAGTMDLDVGLALAILNCGRYRELGARLRSAGFNPDVNEKGNERLQTWVLHTSHSVTVDFLIPPTDERDIGGTRHHLEADLAAIVTPGLELAFRDQRWKEVSGHISSGAWASRSVAVCGPGAFTVLKALAFGNRTENKDAYDLFYVWTGVGIAAVAERLALLQPSAYIDNALNIVKRDFCNHEGLGPLGAAHFIAQGPDEAIQADVVGHAQELLRLMGRL